MNTTDGKMTLILGTDFPQKNEQYFRELSIGTMWDRKEIVIEVRLGSGERFTLLAKMPHFCGYLAFDKRNEVVYTSGRVCGEGGVWRC